MKAYVVERGAIVNEEEEGGRPARSMVAECPEGVADEPKTMLEGPQGMGLSSLKKTKKTMKWKKLKLRRTKRKRMMVGNVGQNLTKRVWLNDRAQTWVQVRKEVQ